MTAAVFFVLAVVVIAAAVVAVAAPSTRLALLGVLVTDILVGVLLVAAGSVLLGLLTVLAPGGCLLLVAWALRRSGHRGLLVELPALTRRWPLAAAAAAATGLVLLWTADAGAAGDATGGARASLSTVLHYRTPVALVVAVGLAVLAVLGALLIGRTGADEHRLDQAAAQRRLHQQRSLVRRQQRAEARARRSGPTTPA